MEKDKLLDTADKKKVNIVGCTIRSLKVKAIYFVYLLPIVCCLLLTGCSLPRIIILDDPLTPEEHINLGVIYENKGLIENAIEEYKKAAKIIPTAYLYLGNAYMQKGDMDEAEKYYKKAIKRQPDLADAYNNLAWLYYTKKDNLDEAKRLALKALELNPSNENYKDTLNKIKELIQISR